MELCKYEWEEYMRVTQSHAYIWLIVRTIIVWSNLDYIWLLYVYQFWRWWWWCAPVGCSREEVHIFNNQWSVLTGMNRIVGLVLLGLWSVNNTNHYAISTSLNL